LLTIHFQLGRAKYAVNYVPVTIGNVDSAYNRVIAGLPDYVEPVYKGVNGLESYTREYNQSIYPNVTHLVNSLVDYDARIAVLKQDLRTIDTKAMWLLYLSSNMASQLITIQENIDDLRSMQNFNSKNYTAIASVTTTLNTFNSSIRQALLVDYKGVYFPNVNDTISQLNGVGNLTAISDTVNSSFWNVQKNAASLISDAKQGKSRVKLFFF
jgi:hypothetical protein